MKTPSHKTPFAALLCYLIMLGALAFAAYYAQTNELSLVCGLAAAIPFYLGGQVIDWLARQCEATREGTAAIEQLLQETKKLTAIQREHAARAEVKDIAASVRVSRG
jgi:hypothetical protein